MLAVAEAQSIVLRHTLPLKPGKVALNPEALGLVLAEDILGDRDMPPFDKALMDGYAVRAADLVEGSAILTVVEEITAGKTPERVVGIREASRIMTGAPIPPGADAVVMVERTSVLDESRVRIEDKPARAGQNIAPRGQEIRAGQIVLPAGTLLRPLELGLLATVGRTTALAYPAPQVAILSTGDEVVEAGDSPGPSQIRNSNGPMLASLVVRAGGRQHYLGIARDRLDSLRPLIAEGLTQAVLILSGGVSAGKLDLVPGVLQELGVEAHFHKIAMKPGKPVFFGSRISDLGSRNKEEKSASNTKCAEQPATLVFGLPGNPVSALVCFELFVRPALLRLGGHSNAGPTMVQAKLAEDFAYRTDRPTYYPAKLTQVEAGWSVQPIPWTGSADLRSLTQANAFVLLPPGDLQHHAGQAFPVLCMDGCLPG